MKEAMQTLIDNINKDYIAWQQRGGEVSDIKKQMIADFTAGTQIEEGSKYIKIVKASGGQRSVWGFVVKGDNDKKFRKGDILKAASWAAPARNFARGNVLDGGYQIRWTGA